MKLEDIKRAIQVAKSAIEYLQTRQEHFSCYALDYRMYKQCEAEGVTPATNHALLKARTTELLQAWEAFVLATVGHKPWWWGVDPYEGRGERITMLKKWISKLEGDASASANHQAGQT